MIQHTIQAFLSRAPKHKPAAWMQPTLFAAAAYNALWGTWVGLFPRASFDLLGMRAPAYLPLWQSVGLMVGCYAIGYFIAAFDPYRGRGRVHRQGARAVGHGLCRLERTIAVRVRVEQHHQRRDLVDSIFLDFAWCVQRSKRLIALKD
jgi:hypothetical protein